MAHRYSVTIHPIETLLTWVKSKEIAIPEIQRPFVWEASKFRNLLDSLYKGYPVGYLIAWKNPTIKLKDGSSAAGKRILIDGAENQNLGGELLTMPKADLAPEACIPCRDAEWLVRSLDLSSEGQQVLDGLMSSRNFANRKLNKEEPEQINRFGRLSNIQQNGRRVN